MYSVAVIRLALALGEHLPVLPHDHFAAAEGVATDRHGLFINGHLQFLLKVPRHTRPLHGLHVGLPRELGHRGRLGAMFCCAQGQVCVERLFNNLGRRLLIKISLCRDDSRADALVPRRRVKVGQRVVPVNSQALLPSHVRTMQDVLLSAGAYVKFEEIATNSTLVHC